MSEYTRAEVVAQIVAAAVQAFDEEDGASRSAVVDLAIEHADFVNMIAIALMFGQVIHEFDQHMQEEHDAHVNHEKLTRHVRELVDSVVREVEGRGKGGTSDTGSQTHH